MSDVNAPQAQFTHMKDGTAASNCAQFSKYSVRWAHQIVGHFSWGSHCNQRVFTA